MVGASGAISGVMGAYLVLYPTVAYTHSCSSGFFFTSIALPAWAMLGYWFVIQLVSGVGSIGGEGAGVAFWAHVGGFVAGIVLVKLFARPEYVAEHRAHKWRPQRVAGRRPHRLCRPVFKGINALRACSKFQVQSSKSNHPTHRGDGRSPYAFF